MSRTPARSPNPRAGLIALNAVALAALAWVALAPAASAQNQRGGGATGGSPRARGEYTMVSGRVLSLTEEVIYVIDASNAELLALRWDNSRKTLSGLGYRDIAADSKRGSGKGR